QRGPLPRHGGDMSKLLPLVARILLGLVFLVFGSNKLIHFLTLPPMPGPAGDFMGALLGSGFFFYLLGTVETASGVLLLAGRYVPLALAMLAGPIVSILVFHITLAPVGLPIATLALACELYLAWAYRESFAGILKADARPGPAAKASADVSAKAV